MPPRKKSTPNTRASAGKKKVDAVRRKYNVNTTKHRKLLPSEVEHVETMVVVLKLAGYPQIQISQIVGISRVQVKEMLDDPKVIEKLILLRAKLPEASLQLLQGYMIEAVQAIVYVMRTSPESKYVLGAASEILDRAGLAKTSRQERHNLNEERTTFGDDGIVEKLRNASPEVQEEAAQIIERLESLLGAHADAAAEDAKEGVNDEQTL